MINKTRLACFQLFDLSLKTSPWISWLVLIGWLATIFYFSHQPTLPGFPDDLADLFLKKTAHASAYAVLMGLWWWNLRQIWGDAPVTLWLALVFTAMYALSDEWHQTFIPGRNGQFADILVDFSGALFALIALRQLIIRGVMHNKNEQRQK